MALPEIVLRPVAESDAEILLRWAPDKLGGYTFPCEAEGIRRMVREWNAGRVNGKSFIMRLIEADGNAVGLLSLYGDGTVSVGVSIAADMRRRRTRQDRPTPKSCRTFLVGKKLMRSRPG